MPSANRDGVAVQHLKDLGLRVRKRRRDLDLSQEQLAHEAGMHRTAIGAIEHGTRDFGVSGLWPLAAALGVEVADLFEPPRTR